MTLFLDSLVNIDAAKDEILLANDAVVSVFHEFNHDTLVTMDLSEAGAMAAAHVNGKALDYDLSQLTDRERELVLKQIDEAIAEHFATIVTGDILHVQVI